MSATILATSEALFDFIDKCLDDKPNTVGIATFNVNLRYLPRDKSRLFPCRAMQLLQRLENTGPNTTILVGVPNEHLEHRRVRETADQYRRLHWKMSCFSHAKLWVFWYTRRVVAVTGGHNLSCSSWLDVSVALTGSAASDLARTFNKFWSDPRSLTV